MTTITDRTIDLAGLNFHYREAGDPDKPALVLPAPPDEAPDDVSFDWRMLVAVMKEIRSPDPSWWYGLSKITVRTLMIGGGATSEVPQERLSEAARLMPDCRLVTVEGAGHYVHQNRPEEYKELLRQFLFETTP